MATEISSVLKSIFALVIIAVITVAIDFIIRYLTQQLQASYLSVAFTLIFLWLLLASYSRVARRNDLKDFSKKATVAGLLAVLGLTLIFTAILTLPILIVPNLIGLAITILLNLIINFNMRSAKTS